MKKHLLIAFSGGRTSALMARLVQVSPVYEGRDKTFIFANTGKEREETLRFIHECDTRWGLNVVWVEAVINPEKGKGTRHRVVTYETAIRNTDPLKDGHPFYDAVKKYGVPSKIFQFCTRELKLATMLSYLRSKGLKAGTYEEAVGIRPDEPKRIGQKENVVYPMVEFGIDERMVRDFWAKQEWDLGLKDYEGNCDLCYKKSLRKRLTIISDNPKIAEDWATLEKVGRQVQGTVMDRDRLGIPSIVELAADPALIRAVDKHDARLAEETAVNPQMFEVLNGIDLDASSPCRCSSSEI